MLNKSDHLKAISWECDRVGLSYGKVTTTYTPEQLNRVYREYEQVQAEKKRREAEMLARKKEKINGTADEFEDTENFYVGASSWNNPEIDICRTMKDGRHLS